MVVRSVYVMNPQTGEETRYPSIAQAAKAMNTDSGHVHISCKRGFKCRGFYCRFGELSGERETGAKINICFDCKKACGKCSWSAVDPDTGKLKYEPVPGWTAEKVLYVSGWSNGKPCHTETYHITDCPLFEQDDPRKVDYRELTHTESEDFLKSVGYLLKRWEDG